MLMYNPLMMIIIQYDMLCSISKLIIPLMSCLAYFFNKNCISFVGLWAVINTADVCLKGRIEIQESAQWETLFKTNVFGTLKTARTFYPLLVSQKGK